MTIVTAVRWIELVSGARPRNNSRRSTFVMHTLAASSSTRTWQYSAPQGNRLEHLNSNDWNLIADKSCRLRFARGEALIVQGRRSGMVYVIASGTAVVSTAKSARLAELEAGDVCGEMAFLEGTLPSASVIAESEIEVCAIQFEKLQELFELYPHLASRFYRSLAVNLSRRLRKRL